MKHSINNRKQRQPYPVKTDPDLFDPDLAALREQAFRHFHLKKKRKKSSIHKTRHLKTPDDTDTHQQRNTISPRARKSSIYGPFPRVIVGYDTVNQLSTELDRLHLSLPLLVSSPSRLGLARTIQSKIAHLDSRILDTSVATVPSSLTGRDCVVSIGGGSAVTLARTVAYRKQIPHICIPTTYNRNELVSSPARLSPSTGGLAQSRGASNAECTRISRTLPAVVIYDKNLTDTTSPTRFQAPSDADIMNDFYKHQNTPRGENARWGFLDLPGV